MSEVKLILGDCLEKMKEIPDNSIDAVITDPPYGIGIEKWDTFKKYEYLKFLNCVSNEINRVLKDKGSLYFMQGETYFAETKIILDKYFKYRNCIIWYRIGSGNQLDWTKSYDFIFFYTKGEEYYFLPQIEKGRLLHRYGFMGLKEYRDEYGWYRERKMTNVWIDIPRFYGRNPRKLKHTCQKPEKLFERILLSSTKEGDVVLDPFMGSGTTGVACVNLNRNFIGIEIEPTYFEIAKKRIEDANKNGKLTDFFNGVVE